MSKTLQQEIRERLGRMRNPGYPKKTISLRHLSHEIGVSHITIYRFLNEQSINGKSLDKIAAFVEKPKS